MKIRIMKAGLSDLTDTELDVIGAGHIAEGLRDIREGVVDLLHGNFEGLRDIREGVRDIAHH